MIDPVQPDLTHMIQLKAKKFLALSCFPFYTSLRNFLTCEGTGMFIHLFLMFVTVVVAEMDKNVNLEYCRFLQIQQ